MISAYMYLLQTSGLKVHVYHKYVILLLTDGQKMICFVPSLEPIMLFKDIPMVYFLLLLYYQVFIVSGFRVCPAQLAFTFEWPAINCSKSYFCS